MVVVVGMDVLNIVFLEVACAGTVVAVAGSGCESGDSITSGAIKPKRVRPSNALLGAPANINMVYGG